MDTMSQPRASRIKDRFDDHFLREVGVSVATPEPQWWWDRMDQYGSLAVLGWAWPQTNPRATDDNDIHPIIVPYCPEIIDEQAAELTDAVFDGYLDIIQWVLDTHISEWDITDGEERHTLVSLMLETEFPAQHRFLNDALGLASLRLAIRGFDDNLNG